MTGVLFDRRCALQVADTRLEGFDLAFDITKSLSAKTPNSAEVRVFNLSAAHRKALQESEAVYVSLEAGYASGTSLLFRGDLRDVVSTRQGADWVTFITSDSGRRARKQRIVKSFAPGASVGDVLNAAAKAMGVKLGNSAARVVEAKIAGTKSSVFWNGYALAGAIEAEMDRLARSCGLEWSVQDDELQFLDYGAPLAEFAVVLTADTGMVGSPEPGNRGLCEVRTLIIPDLSPGRRVEVRSEHVRGMFRIEVAKYTGSTFGDDWYVDLQLKSEQRKAAS